MVARSTGWCSTARNHLAGGGSLLLAWLLPVALVAQHSGRDSARSELAGRVVLDTVHSRALQGNLLGDPSDQPVAVYLPPGYDRKPERRYPVIYLLPPFGGGPGTWTRAWPGLFGPRSGVAVIDSTLAAGGMREVIVVMPDGRNRYHGSFFANSPVTGDWEDFLAQEVVEHVDRTYRTLRVPESRGLAGHSMGGNAALRVGMNRPKVFGAVYALSPCCLEGYDQVPDVVWERLLSYEDVDALQRGYREGDFYGMTVVAAGAWITPNPDDPPFFVDLPVRLVDGELRRDEELSAHWAAATLTARINEKLNVLRDLRGLYLDHGNRESASLVEGVRQFSQALSERGVAHRYEVYDGTHHSRIMERLGTRMLPFFDEALTGPPPGERVYADTLATWFEDVAVTGTVSQDERWVVLADWRFRTLFDRENNRLATFDEVAPEHDLDRIFGVRDAGGGRLALYGVRGDEVGWFLRTGEGTTYTGLTPDVAPSWSPDGESVAFVRGTLDTLFVRAGGELSSHAVARPAGAPVWAPDASAAYLLGSGKDGTGVLFEIEPETGAVDRLREGLDIPVGASTLAFSADGDRVFLALAGTARPSPEARHDPAADRDLDIYALDLGSGALELVAATPQDDFAPVIAGNHLYWTRNADSDAVVVLPAGGGPSRVVAEGGSLPSWSPDGRRIAYTHGGGLADGALSMDASVVAIDVEGNGAGDAEPIVAGVHEDFTPAWSPDGEWIAYHSHRSDGPVPYYAGESTTDDLYIRRPEAPLEEEIRLTDFGWEVGPVDWSPDGRRIVFDSWERGGRPGVSKPWIATIDPASGALVDLRRLPLPEGVDNATMGSWSPDGNRIAFDVRHGGNRHAIWVVSPQGTGAEKLAEFRSETYGGLDWSPDGSAIVYSALVGGRMQLLRVERAGGSPQVLTDGAANLLHPQISPDGRWISATRMVRVKEVRRMEIDR